MSHREHPETEQRPVVGFRLLGALDVVRASRPVLIPAAKQRIALATLLLHADQHVSVDQLIAYMWHRDTPNDARATVYTHIARLRQALDDGGDGRRLIHTREFGYLIQVGDAGLDVARFHRLVRRAERTAEPDAEAALLHDALALWRGPALADVPSDALRRDHAVRLEEERVRTLERWLELRLRGGGHEQVVAELQAATAAHPLRERLWAQLMLALYRCGRQAEALVAYRSVAGLLREELGIDPGDELRDLHQSILAGDPRLLLPSPTSLVPPTTTPGAPPTAVPPAPPGGASAAPPITPPATVPRASPGGPPVVSPAGGPARAAAEAAIAAAGEAVAVAGGGAAVLGSVAEQQVPADVRPWQLPSDIAAFTGRAEALMALDRLLEPARDQPTHYRPVHYQAVRDQQDRDQPDRDQAGRDRTGLAGPGGSARPVRIAVITGTAGVGKTALAVHWGHRTRRHFPDGQLYVNLRGFGPDGPMEPATALEVLLQGLDVPAQRIPADLDARSALLRSVLATRHVLMVLDNARDAAQVRPLLPGSAGVVLITSRDQLRALSVHGDTSHVTLGVFSPQESAELLASILGSDRARAEPEATAELGRLCAHLPLALRIAVANLTLDQYQSVADYVAELREGNRLAALRIDGDERSAVRGTLDLSYTALPEPTRASFRLLGLVPGADFTVEAAAALSGSTAEEARRQLTRLATAHLIHHYAPGRYRLHDLLRLYAAERVHAEQGPPSLEAARHRLYDWYLRSARAAVECLHPNRARLPLSPAPADVTPAVFDDPTAALSWLTTEHGNLVDAVHQAVSAGPRPSVWLLTDALRSHFWSSGHMRDWLSCARVAVAVAEEEGDVSGLAAAVLVLADAHAFGERLDAESLYARALSHADAAGWAEGQSSIRGNLAGNYLRHGRLPEAARCFEEGMRLDRHLGREAGLGVKHSNLGVVYAQLGRLGPAYDHLSRALRFSTGRHANARTNLGIVCHLMGRYDEAHQLLTQVRAHLERAPDHLLEPYCAAALADILCDLGRYDEARDLANRALAGSRDLEDHLAEAGALFSLGLVLDGTGRPEQAIERFHEAVERVGDANPYTKVSGLVRLAYAATGLGLAEAGTYAEQALRISRERSFRLQEGLALTACAGIAGMAGDRGRAVREFEAALEIHRETGHRPGEARTLRMFADALGGTAAAESYRRRAVELSGEMGAP
ncbi:BTAD domain-containing putative transcriptional regulator [Nonomuraea sp. NPDC050643]|uniref:AfsR/SARP family transcriptional regulator n=1 Tax=Nonomuraea sp. NPDC050643 TaxID=3155660 RepID=UPI0033F88A0C